MPFVTPDLTPRFATPVATPMHRKAVPYAAFANFLDPVELQDLLAYVESNEARFQPSSVEGGAEGYRSSLVLFDANSRWEHLVKHRVILHRDEAIAQLGIAPFVATDVEVQVTRSGDGDFFKHHTDNATPSTASRYLTYVFYFNREQRGFQGGDLLLYSGPDLADHVEIEPVNNSPVVFPSSTTHEVLPVNVPSGQFMDGRFTINGWLRR